jgi:hypothetical protein
MADLFEKIIDRAQKKYGCMIIYFTTDCDGGSKKGREILGKRRTYLLVPECWAHQVGMVEFGSELWFEPEPLRTGPWFGPRFGSEGELNRWSGPRF